MNFETFKKFTDAQKLNSELRRQKKEIGLEVSPDARKVLPIEIEIEKRKRKEPSKYDE